MEHEILNKEHIGNNIWIYKIILLPKDNLESNILKKVELFENTYFERQLIDDYVSFNLNIGNYTIIDSINDNSTFTLKVLMN